MGFADLSSRDSVLQAIEECRKLGEQPFLEKYGYGLSRHIRLFLEGEDYPAKAILGVAHRFQFPDEGPLGSTDFTSGESTIAKFGQMGFDAHSVLKDRRLFVVRAGRDEELAELALESSMVIAGWSELGDLSILNDADLAREMDAAYGDQPVARLAAWKGGLRAFKKIAPGDLVILPLTSHGAFAVGEVSGPYAHRADSDPLEATHTYPVAWLATDLPRDLLGDLQTRVDRPLAVHEINVPLAADLVLEMVETREPIRSPGSSRLQSLFEAVLTALVDKDQDRVRNLVDHEGPALLAEVLEAPHPVSTGTGQATPADVPWISIYPPGGTASAQQGVYAVYLFAADGSAVYLSFNQGTEKVAGGIKPIRKRALDMQRATGIQGHGDAVSLESANTRPKKYEAGSAYAVRYAHGSVPVDETLVTDLSMVLNLVDAAITDGLDFDPQLEPLHLLFKWSSDIEPETVELHQAVADKVGHVWWGRFGIGGISGGKLAALEGQWEDGVPTHAYLYGDKRLFRTRVDAYTASGDDVPDSERPDYYPKDKASFFVRLSEFEELQPSWALENLLLASNPDPELTRDALGNRTTPIFVYERFAIPASDVVPKTELTLNWLQQETLWTADDLGEALAALDPETGKGQIILAGPPGTGKTWVAERLARYLTQDQPLQRRLVQFHPSYGYEEFMEGIRPVANDEGISFAPVKGTVLEMAEGMEGSEELKVLVIDELNRANIPRVFGELLYLLEYRNREIELQYSPTFRLPDKLRFIATMNTADRSVRSIDVALRRRFEVFECLADSAVLERFYERPGHVSEVPNLVDGFEKLNADLTERIDRHHAIGQSFFMSETYSRERLERTWKRQILPLVEDYFFDQQDVVADFTVNKYWPPAT